MSGLLLGKMLIEKYVSQVSLATTANDLGAHPIGIRDAHNGPGHFIIKARPATV